MGLNTTNIAFLNRGIAHFCKKNLIGICIIEVKEKVHYSDYQALLRTAINYALDPNNNKKLIVVGEENILKKPSDTEYRVFREAELKVSDLTESSLAKLLTKKIKFQNEEVLLGEIIDNNLPLLTSIKYKDFEKAISIGSEVIKYRGFDRKS